MFTHNLGSYKLYLLRLLETMKMKKKAVNFQALKDIFFFLNMTN